MTSQTPIIAAFQNESESLEREGVTVENRLDEVAIYGETSIPRTREGLRRAQFLRAVLDAAVAALESDPELQKEPQAPVEPTMRDNPFA